MSCSVRLLNEASTAVTIFSAGSPLVVSSPGSVSDYASFACGSSVSVAGGAGTPTLLNRGVSSTFSVLATTNSSSASNINAFVLGDATAAYPDVDDGSTIDTAGVRVVNARSKPVIFSGVPDECWGCALPLQFGGKAIAVGGAAILNVSTKYGYDFALDGVRGQSLSRLDEHGMYTLLLRANGGTNLVVDVRGQDANLPLLWLALLVAASFVVHRLMTSFFARRAAAAVRAGMAKENAGALPTERRAVTLSSFFAFDTAAAAAAATAIADRDSLAGRDSTEHEEALLGSRDDANPVRTVKKKAERVLAIDTFRGVSLCIMIFVNAGGGKYYYLNHSRWNGLTVADLVFPWFVFTSGVSAAISLSIERRKGATRSALIMRALARSLKLALLGTFIINSPLFLGHARIPSVLGYFAVSGALINMIDVLVPVLGTEEDDSAPPTTLLGSLWLDFGRYAWQWCAMGVIGAIYLGIQFLLPVAGCPTGYLGPGGLADNNAFGLCTGGAHHYIDNQLFGPNHIDSSPTCSGTDGVYQCSAHDPEGALGALSATWMAWLGLVAGRALVLQRDFASRVGGDSRSISRSIASRWAASAIVLCTIAGLMCGFKKEGGWIPVNKNLWSPSFVLLLAGFANALLAINFVGIDALKLWDGAPFRFVGANSLAIYLTSELLCKRAPFLLYFNATNDWATHSEALASNALVVVVLLIIARFWHLHGWSYNV